MFKRFLEKLNGAALAAFVAVTMLPSLVFADPPGIGDLADSVDFDDVAPAIIGVAGALITLYVIIKGVKIVIGFVRS